MPSDTRYTDEQVESQAADREAWGQTDAAAMLRALLADRARVEAELDIHRCAVDEAEAMIARLEGEMRDLKNILREQGRIHDSTVAGLRADRAALLAEVRAWRAAIENGQVADEWFFYAVNIECLDKDRIDAARRATDALLGAEVTG